MVPCVIFLDEVDALLHYRMLDVRSWKLIMQGKYGIAFEVREYEEVVLGAEEVAEKLGLPLAQVWKTLVCKVDGMPKNAGDAVRRSGVNDRSPSGRLQGAEGQKVLLSQYARKVDAALRGLLAGSDIPLVLAAAHPLEPIYRSVNSYSHLASMTIAGSPETLSDADLAARARSVLDGLYDLQN